MIAKTISRFDYTIDVCLLNYCIVGNYTFVTFGYIITCYLQYKISGHSVLYWPISFLYMQLKEKNISLQAQL